MGVRNLIFLWTRGDLNPGLIHAMDACYHYTTGPLRFTQSKLQVHTEVVSKTTEVPPGGLEPPTFPLGRDCSNPIELRGLIY